MNHFYIVSKVFISKVIDLLYKNYAATTDFLHII